MILSIDTATSQASLAIGEPGERVPDAIIASKNDLSKRIGTVAASLCRDRGITPRELSGIIIADGPGSFTGLRIGAAFAKGMHDAAKIPLYTAPSLLGAALAAGSAAAAGRVAVVAEYDALRGDVYRAIYDFPVIGDRSSVTIVVAPELVPREAPPHVRDYAVADERNASASALLRLMGMAGGPAPIEHPATWEPSYGRPAEAEARRLSRDAAR
ncbi:MAG TPA: tRNA (adenosine(37)-N6)-threonylcarbamoyltransferase complex dimerization subunit type 1 TsaB [Reyranella sp.]|nr:tRNA (adenosine(37)-N6)-threonylcarbamoyltransferase complex dimerization subunit type 1 TsaB [Reyranella sp.]